MAKSTIGVKIDAAVRKRLESLAAARRRSTHWLVQDAIARYLEAEEGAELARRETLERWEKFQMTGAHVTDEEVDDWLADWGTAKEKPWRKRRH